jgi:Cys-tRNA(Pro)/Cys-tRNA(Cys) deacylase
MTPAIRALQKAQVAFTLHPYEHDPSAESYGLEAAEALGVPPERVFKTLVCSADGVGLLLALVPASGQLDLKALAAALGVKKAGLADPEAAQRATGYVLGGISPLGGRKALPTLIDASALGHETIHVSAGKRGLQVELAPADLVALTGASSAELCAS